MRIRTNDQVKVICGVDAGQTGKVLRVDHDSNRIIVEGINRVYKHVRRSQRNPQGGRLSKEMPISVSNVLLVCGACGQGTRVGVRYAVDGSKERFCKKCSKSISRLSPPRARYAKKK